MQKDVAVKNTLTAWLIVKGTWPTRLDLHCETDRDKAVVKLVALGKTNPEIRIERAQLIMIKGQWHRINVNPVLCDVPATSIRAKAKELIGKINSSLAEGSK